MINNPIDQDPNQSLLQSGSVAQDQSPWFFYWKYAASLWPSKLQEWNPACPVWIPLSWSFQSNFFSQAEFSETVPESDLGHLIRLLQQYSLRACFFIPLNPFPYLPNGGIPAKLANNFAMTEMGLSWCVVDSEGRINNFHSYFDPEVYKGFRKYLRDLSQFLRKGNNPFPILGLISGYMQGQRFYSYLEEYSEVYQQGIQRFVQMQEDEANELLNRSKNLGLDQNRDELQNKYYHKNFCKDIEALYSTTARELLQAQWGGIIKLAFLGGGPNDIFSRYSDTLEFKSRYFPDIIHSMGQKVLPTSLLLSKDLKVGPIDQTLNKFNNDDYLMQIRDEKVGEIEELQMFGFLPLKLFQIFQGDMNQLQSTDSWDRLALVEFLSRNYQGTYQFFQQVDENLFENDFIHGTYFFAGEDLDQQTFQFMLKIFLGGGNVILDRTYLGADLEKRLELFFWENSIACRKFHYIVDVDWAILGGGNLLMVQGGNLHQFPLIKKYAFWEKLVDTIKMGLPIVREEKDVYYFWTGKEAGLNENQYEEIRRLVLVNPTSYKKKVNISLVANYSYYKDKLQACKYLKKSSLSLDIEFSPSGMAQIDFGYCEEE